jgi:hypothetical protein
MAKRAAFESQEIMSIRIKIILTVLLDFKILKICELNSLWNLARSDKVLELWDPFFYMDSQNQRIQAGLSTISYLCRAMKRRSANISTQAQHYNLLFMSCRRACAMPSSQLFLTLTK